MISRRTFLHHASLLFSTGLMGFSPVAQKKTPRKVITVNGPLRTKDLGYTLIHEHILVDFSGFEHYDPTRWDKGDVIKKILPLLKEVKAAGCNTLIDCTPNYLGRDVLLLQKLSNDSGLNIITNTGYYGGSDVKFLPPHAFSESVDQLALRWIREAQHGIDNTAVKPGFMKISVNPGPLSEVSRKLITAAARCHLQTGLTIASHTGPATPAFEQIDIVKREGVSADAFIWVHAQTEKDSNYFVRAVRSGAWVSLDGLGDTNVDEYAGLLSFLKKEKCLHRILVSHDAGWYDPDKPEGGEIRGYTTLFKKLIPALEQVGFSEREIIQLIEVNPGIAFEVRKRRVKRR